MRLLLNISHLIKDKHSGWVLYTKYTPNKCIGDKQLLFFYDNIAMPTKKPYNITSLTIVKITKFM